MKKIDFFKILSYAEVASFGKNQRNRKVKDSHVNDFMNVIRDGKFAIHCDDGTYLPFGAAPIIVNPNTGHILDGQHKKEAFIKAYEKGILDDNAGILVSYWPIDDPDLENLLTIALNTNTKKWLAEDYMNCYSQYIESYQMLKDFCLSHELCHEVTKSGSLKCKYRTATAMMTGKNCGSVLNSGAFSFSHEQARLADTIHDELKAIRKFLGMRMVGTDIEAMAIQWVTHRKMVSVSDITSLPRVSRKVYSMLTGVPNQKAWDTVFSVLESVIRKRNLKIAA